MSDIAFTREEKDALVAKLQRYFDDELRWYNGDRAQVVG